MSDSRLILTRYKHGILSMLIDDNRAQAISFYDDVNKDHIGDIYIGKVLNVVPNINAAFIDYQKGKRGYLPIHEGFTPVLINRKFDGRILAGDEILVQYEKEAIRSKEPVFTMDLSLAGKYCVVTNANSKKGVSTKIEKKYKEILYNQIPKDTSFGIIVRTNAQTLIEEEKDLSIINEECNMLIDSMDKLLSEGIHRTCFSCIHKTTPAYLTDIRDNYFGYYDIEKVICDDKLIFGEIKDFVSSSIPELEDKVSLYEDESYSLSKLYSIETKLSEVLDKKVWLKSGAYLVIEQTEAMYVIDVNSGKNTSKKNNSEYIFSINIEAAKEIIRQLRLRNLSGMILVDFINMEDKELESKLIHELKKMARTDRIKTNVIDITGLGLVEITRKKTKKSLKSQILQTQE